MKFVNVLSFSFLVFLFIVSCDTSEPPQQSELLLKLEDVSCTEAWLQLTSANIQLPNNISVLINGSVKKTLTLNSKDSLIYIDSLFPNQTYKLLATMQQGNNVSNELSITTLDTTSHNFNWQTFTLGDIGAGSSLIYDVAIIDANNIWAVGEIYMNDSLGYPDPSMYNLIKWDGVSWKPERVLFKNSQGQSFLAPMKSIFAFNVNDIWIGLDQMIYWNGSTYESIELPDAVFQSWINKIWGSSSNDLYAVGNNGNLAHYNGTSWTKIESGTTSTINDAWGVFDNGTATIYCAASSFFEPQLDKKILKITNGKVDSVSWKVSRLIYSCWTINNTNIYVCGSGVYNNKSGQWYQENLPAVSMNMIRGNALNDIFLIGDFGFAAHFNGASWQIYNESFGDIYRIAFNNNNVSFVGQKNGFGYIVIGKRN